jgi:hypothetical protein
VKLTWTDKPAGDGKRQFMLTGEYKDRDGKPFYFCQAWVAAESEAERLRRDQGRAAREIGKDWRRRWTARIRLATRLGVNVRDVPSVGDGVAPGHVFGVDWYARVENGIVTMVDVTRRRDGSPRTPARLA